MTQNLINTQPQDDAKTQLKQKVEESFAKYKEEWLGLSPSQLIDRCEEIEAVTRMARNLVSSISDEDAEYLLRFKNPLEVVSDEWASSNGIDSLIIDEELRHILWELSDRGEAEQYYELEPGYESTLSMDSQSM